MIRWMESTLGLAGLLLGLAACSGEGVVTDEAAPAAGPGAVAPGATTPANPSNPANPANPGSAAGGAGATSPSVASSGVADYGRPPGMAIGQGASGNVDPGSPPDTPAAVPDDGAEGNDDLEIPVFTAMPAAPPCKGCVELNVDVNDINQRDNFAFPGGNTNVTRVVWTLIVPFNSDQLFVQPYVDNVYGAFTDLDANAFAIDQPVQLVQTLPARAAGTVGLAVGSSGAWTGNQTMSVFVESVTLEGSGAPASRTFDANVEGMTVASNAHNPKIVYHP